jgi:hypothetical protein
MSEQADIFNQVKSKLELARKELHDAEGFIEDAADVLLKARLERRINLSTTIYWLKEMLDLLNGVQQASENVVSVKDKLPASRRLEEGGGNG